MVRASQRAIAYSGTDAHHHGRHIRIANVVLDLFQSACRQEAGWRNTEWFFATGCEASSDADEVLFGNAYFNNLPGQRFSKWCELA